MSIAWPTLDFARDKGTYTTCHLILQLLGKLPTRLHPWLNHGWHVAFRLTPYGYVTRVMPAGAGRHFNVALDLRKEIIFIGCDQGSAAMVSVPGRTIAELHCELTAKLTEAGLPAPLWGGPNEMPDPVPFAQDTTPREWDGDAARRLHGAFVNADRVFNAFRTCYTGKSSPSHLFWGSFDLAVTRFSGRAAPAHPGGIPHLPDPVTREAYSHEVISAGFWPGGGGMDDAAFYTYSYPVPDALAQQKVSPQAAFWHQDMGEFVLPYAAVATASDPEAALMEFLQSTYAAAAQLLDWPTGLTCDAPAYGHPPVSQS